MSISSVIDVIFTTLPPRWTRIAYLIQYHKICLIYGQKLLAINNLAMTTNDHQWPPVTDDSIQSSCTPSWWGSGTLGLAKLQGPMQEMKFASWPQSEDWNIRSLLIWVDCTTNLYFSVGPSDKTKSSCGPNYFLVRFGTPGTLRTTGTGLPCYVWIF
jgi:hypothetical protein